MQLQVGMVVEGKVTGITKFGAFVTMFPQLIAGPIVRYADIDAQLAQRNLSLYKFGQGIAWFLRGLGKKVLLATWPTISV